MTEISSKNDGLLFGLPADYFQRLRDAVALAVPAGIPIAIVHELGFFTALGLPQPWRFSAVLPIPLSELARISLLASLACLTGYVVVLATLETVKAAVRMFMAYVQQVDVAFGDSTDFSLATFLTGNWGGMRHKAATEKPSAPAWRKRPGERFTWRTGSTSIVLLATVWIGMVYVAKPAIGLVMALQFPVRNLGSTGLSLFVFTAAAVVAVGLLAWSLGASFGKVISSSLSRSVVFSICSASAFFLVYDLGYTEAALTTTKLLSANIGEVAFADSSKKCPKLTAPILLRSYSNGYLLQEEDTLIFYPSSTEACMQFHVNKPRLVLVKTVPTLFGNPIPGTEIFQLRELPG